MILCHGGISSHGMGIVDPWNARVFVESQDTLPWGTPSHDMGIVDPWNARVSAESQDTLP